MARNVTTYVHRVCLVETSKTVGKIKMSTKQMVVCERRRTDPQCSHSKWVATPFSSDSNKARKSYLIVLQELSDFVLPVDLETVHPLHFRKFFVHFLEFIDSVFQVVSEFAQFFHCTYVLHVNAILKLRMYRKLLFNPESFELHIFHLTTLTFTMNSYRHHEHQISTKRV